jgi:hypothetical protein
MSKLMFGSRRRTMNTRILPRQLLHTHRTFFSSAPGAATSVFRIGTPDRYPRIGHSAWQDAVTGEMKPQDAGSGLVERSWQRRSKRQGERTERTLEGEQVNATFLDRHGLLHRQPTSPIGQMATHTPITAIALGALGRGGGTLCGSLYVWRRSHRICRMRGADTLASIGSAGPMIFLKNGAHMNVVFVMSGVLNPG